MVSDGELLEDICVQRGCQNYHQCASCSALRFGIDCIGRLLVSVAHIAILLLCWLDAYWQQWGRILLDHKSKKFGSLDVLGYVRNVFLRFFGGQQRRVESRRIAVGLAPLGRTSNG